MKVLLWAALLVLMQGTLGRQNINAPQAPVWSPTYSVEGVLSIPYAEIEEPFAAYADMQNGKSRIDYYGDTGSLDCLRFSILER